LLPIWDVPHLDVPYYINSSAAVLLTSEREGSPNIVREALSCGVPVCAFEVGDTRKWLELDPQSKVVVPGDISGLVSAVEKVLSQKPAHVRRVDVEMFSVAGAVSRTAKIYLGLKSSH
jgi:glycosyltransferase involved in cell wall biosynthesis